MRAITEDDATGTSVPATGKRGREAEDAAEDSDKTQGNQEERCRVGDLLSEDFTWPLLRKRE